MQVTFQELCKQSIEHIKKNEFDEAEPKIEVLLADFPNEGELTFQLAFIYFKRKKYFIAKLLFKKVIEHCDDLDCMAAAYNNLGYIYYQEGDRKAAMENYEEALRMFPNSDQFVGNYSSMFVSNGTPEKAIELAKKSIDMNPDNVHAKNNLALSYLELGQWEKGFEYYEFRAITHDNIPRNYDNEGKIPDWNGEEGKTVVVYGEQGLGDEIMFASLLPKMAKKVNIILDAHPRLADLFRHSFNHLHIPVYGTRKSLKLHWPTIHDIDYKVALGSLGKFFLKKDDDFSGEKYLTSEDRFLPLLRPYVSQLDQSKKVIAISYQGGTPLTCRNTRYCPLEEFLPLLRHKEFEFVCLQYHPAAESDINDFLKKHPDIKLHYWPFVIDSYDLTAAFLENFVWCNISVPQSIVHLSGALGVKTYQLCPVEGLWQMGVRNKNALWYKSVKNIWQDVSGDWQTVLNKLTKQIEADFTC